VLVTEGLHSVGSFPSAKKEWSVTQADLGARAEAGRYREEASRVRALIPSLKRPEAIEYLHTLADRYEKLADELDAAAGAGR
jgi:hypothetical protein